MKLAFLLAAGLVTGCFAEKKTETERIESTFELPTRQPPPVPPPQAPGFVSFSAFEDLLLRDAQSLSQNDAEDTFYLVGCDRANLGEELQEFKLGVDKGINMLSTERFLTPTTQIGNSGCVFRISQDDYGISDSELEKIAKRGLFTVVSNTIRGDTIKFFLQKNVSWMFADDFFLTAFEGDTLTDYQCNTFCDITEQPLHRNAFFASQGINEQVEYDNEDVVIGGTNDSPIAFGSRLFEFFEADDGLLAVSNDSSLAQPDSINENPFTLESALASSQLDVGRIPRVPVTDKIFQPVAREIISVLPNGLQLFRLENAQNGQAVSAAPANVVFDNRNDSIGLEPVIRLAACSGCHTKGSIGFDDQLSDHVASRSNFDAVEKERARIFMNPTKIQQILRQTDEAQARAASQLGLRGGRDPFNGRLITPSRKPYNSVKASAKFFLTDAQYRACLESGNVIAQNLGAHLGGQQNATPLQVLADNFNNVIEECGLFQEDEI